MSLKQRKHLQKARLAKAGVNEISPNSDVELLLHLYVLLHTLTVHLLKFSGGDISFSSESSSDSSHSSGDSSSEGSEMELEKPVGHVHGGGSNRLMYSKCTQKRKVDLFNYVELRLMIYLNCYIIYKLVFRSVHYYLISLFNLTIYYSCSFIHVLEKASSMEINY